MKKRWRAKRTTFTIFIFFALIFLGVYYFFIILPITKTYSAAQIQSATEKAVNIAVSNVINRSLRYDSLIDITYNSAGEISSFAANQHEINSITREIVKEAQFQMNTLCEDGIKMSIGTFTGIPFFIGKGPLVKLELVPIGIVGSDFKSEFSSVGINMTKHSLSLDVNVRVSVVMPIKCHEFNINNKVLLAESVIVGKVPDVYFNGQGIGKNLNLIP